MPMRMLLFGLCISLGFASSGCMSFEHLIDPQQRVKTYGGVQSSVDYINDPSSPWFGQFVRLLDLPLTTVMDTLLLPVSAPIQLSR